jgi:hypothetical protein
MRRFPCSEDSKVFGPKTRRDFINPVLGEVQSVIGPHPSAKTQFFSDSDYRYFVCDSTLSEIAQAFSSAPWVFDTMNVMQSYTLYRYAVLAERAAWKNSPTHINTLEYLQKFFVIARTSLNTISPLL